MFDKLKNSVRYGGYVVVFLALIIAYLSYRSEINAIVPFENFVTGIIPGMRSIADYFAVVPEYERLAVQPRTDVKKEDAPKIINPELPAVNIAHQVIQKMLDKEILYGYDKNVNLVQVTNDENKVVFVYSQDGFLQQILTPERRVQLQYNARGQLSKISDGDKTTQLKYDFNGFPSKVVLPSGDELVFEFDALGHLLKFQRGVGPATTFYYRDDKLLSFTKSGVTTEFSYENDLIKIVKTNEDHLVLNYGRDNLLSYFAGTKYGLAETISYNANDVIVVSATDKSKFSGDFESVRINAANLYVGCTKIKRLPVAFDPLAYSIFRNYLKKDVVEYFVNNFVCEAVFGRKF